MSYGVPKVRKLNDYESANKSNRRNNTSKAISNNGIKVESINSGARKMTKPVIIPTANTAKRVKKVQEEVEEENQVNLVERARKVEIPKVTKKVEEIEEMLEEPAKRKRGRPKKIQTELEEIIEQPKRHYEIIV